MRTLLWSIAGICFALWSGLAWAAYAFVDVTTAWTSASPLTAGAVADKWTYALAAVGKGAIFLIWGIGTVVILAAPFMIGKALGLSKGLAAAAFSGGRGLHFRSRRGGHWLVRRIAEHVAGRSGTKLLPRW